jgi:hypothetical protein
MYGNRFFHNFARSKWEVRKVQNTNDPEVDIGLLHQKYNEGPLHGPVAMTLEFTEDGVIFAQQDITNIPELLNGNEPSDRRPTYKDKIVFSLQAGSMSVADLANDIGIDQDKTRTILNRYKDTFEKDVTGKLWQLKQCAET